MFPFALLYTAAVWVRNFLFDKNILKSTGFNFPIICVGNLAVGGTGKTPMVEYLVNILQDNFNTATLSRGYKRKTKGFAIAGNSSTALDIGDEPMQFHLKFKNLTVAVGEERLVAIPQLLHGRPQTDVIILDDAFQHRQVKAGLNILLTECGNRYSRDLMMPSGDLRDLRKSSSRAQIIIVTKCKANLNLQEKAAIKKELKLLPAQKLFFTEMIYGQPCHIFSGEQTTLHAATDVLLITGIANPRALKSFLAKHVNSFDMLRYPDHHIFNSGDLKDIQKHFEKLPPQNRIIITTEKDAVRLKKFEKELASYPIFAQPVKHHFLFDEAAGFNDLITDFVYGFKKM